MVGKAILGVILAGGRSTRMGTEKALMTVEGTPLVARVTFRFKPQVADLVLNANGEAVRFAELGLAVINDEGGAEPRFEQQGPLAGIAAALAFAHRAGFACLVTVPVDAPLLPLDLVARLTAAAADELAVAAGPRGMEPLFALWPARLAPVAGAALAAGDGSVRRFIERLPHRLVSFAAADGEPDPFLNLNTPADAANFERCVR